MDEKYVLFPIRLLVETKLLFGGQVKAFRIEEHFKMITDEEL